MSSVDVKEGIEETSKSMETDKKESIVTALDLQSKTDEVGPTSKETGRLGTVTRGKRRKAQHCSESTHNEEVKNGKTSESSNIDDPPVVSENDETEEMQLDSIIKIAKKSKLEPNVPKRSKRKKTQPKKRTPVKGKKGLDHSAADEDNMLDDSDEEIKVDEGKVSENEFHTVGFENSKTEDRTSQKNSRRKNTLKVKHVLDGTEAVDDDDDDDDDDLDADDDYEDIESDDMVIAGNKEVRTFRCVEKYVIKDKNTARLSITCDCCSKLYSSLTTLREHLKVKFNLPKKQIKLHRVFQCNHEGCDKQFKCTSNCKMHMISMHLPDRKYTCEFCAFSFKRRSSLVQHLKSLHVKDEEDFRFQCDVCDKKFRRKIGLEMHSSIHTDDRNYICQHENCGKQFRLQSTLYKHEKCVHSGEKPYECETCGERFTRKTYLRSHMYKHTGLKDYVCDVCFKSFTQNGNLKQHKQSLHGDRKNYQCPQCLQTFNFKSNLTKHLIKHDHHDNTDYSDFAMDDFAKEEEYVPAENTKRNSNGQPKTVIPMASEGIEFVVSDPSSSRNVNKGDKNWVMEQPKTVRKKIVIKAVKPQDVDTRFHFYSERSEDQTRGQNSSISQTMNVDKTGTSEGDVQIFVVEQSTAGSADSVLVPCSVPVATMEHVNAETQTIENQKRFKANREVVDDPGMSVNDEMKNVERFEAHREEVIDDMPVYDGAGMKKEVPVIDVSVQSHSTPLGGHVSVVPDLAEVPLGGHVSVVPDLAEVPLGGHVSVVPDLAEVPLGGHVSVVPDLAEVPLGGHVSVVPHESVVPDLAEVPDKTINQLHCMTMKVETNQPKEPEDVYVTEASVINALEVILGSGEQQHIPASIISKPSTLLNDVVPISAFRNENIYPHVSTEYPQIDNL